MARYEISELARKYAPWSYSKADIARVCPAQFQHKYLMKSKAETNEGASDNKVGIVAHEILERRVKGEPNGIARKAALEKNPLTSDEVESLRVLDDNIEHFLERFDRFCKAERVSKLLTEVQWAFTADYRPTDYWSKDAYFRGQMDLGAVTGDGTLFVLDHKSGEAKDINKDSNKKDQLQAYAVLAAPNIPDIAGVRSGIHFMRGATPELRLQWTDFIETSIVKSSYAPWLFDRINECASNLAHERFDARPAKKMPRGWPCHWCNYQGQCPTFKTKFGGA